MMCDGRLIIDISIHPPRAGRDYRIPIYGYLPQYFNPPAPCGAGPPVMYSAAPAPVISIHPPRAGRDYKADAEKLPSVQFQSTRPVRGGTLLSFPALRLV